MKKIKKNTFFRMFFGCAVVVSLVSCGGGDSSPSESNNYSFVVSALKYGLSEVEVSAVSNSGLVRGLDVGRASLGVIENETPAVANAADPVASYMTIFPRANVAPGSNEKKRMLRMYLDNPGSAEAAIYSAIFYQKLSLTESDGPSSGGERLKHTIVAQYFLHRAEKNGFKSLWLERLIQRNDELISNKINAGGRIYLNEDRPAHVLFNKSFNYSEKDKYVAADALMDEFFEQPRNAYTSFALTAVNSWIGGEGAYDDPTVAENFILGSFFALHTMSLSKSLEELHKTDASVARFRKSTILGGFSALNKRWLAKVHRDDEAVKAIDVEHREWRLVHRAFHAFTLGLSFFDEAENFREGMLAWQDAFTHCREIPILTCSNQPRHAHNFSSFVVTYVDYLLKSGDVDTAKQFLQLRNTPSHPLFPRMSQFNNWTYGKEAWFHRERNADRIAELYKENKVNETPVGYMLYPRKWGANTQSCQSCHQAQGSIFTEEEKNRINYPIEQVASVGTWPVARTTWYGDVVN